MASDKIGSSVNITFKGGRIDCSTSPGDNEDHVFPDASMNRTAMFNWFSKTDFGFGMNEKQVSYVAPFQAGCVFFYNCDKLSNS